MPSFYGTRLAKIQRYSDKRPGSRRTTHTVVITRIDLGPSRRDPQGTLSIRLHEIQRNALQGASAKGSFVVTRRVSRRVSANAKSFEFGVGVSPRLAHANRACVGSPLTHASNHRTVSDPSGRHRRCHS